MSKIAETHRLVDGRLLCVGIDPRREKAGRFSIRWTDVDGETWDIRDDNQAGDVFPNLHQGYLTPKYVHVRDDVLIVTNEGPILCLRPVDGPCYFECHVVET